MEESTNQTVREMAKLAMFANRLSDVQLNNLKMYPFIFFEGVKSVKLDYNLDQTRNVDSVPNTENLEIDYKISHTKNVHSVIYDLQIANTEQTYLDKRVRALTNAVHDLLWKDIKVTILLNGQEIGDVNV